MISDKIKIIYEDEYLLAINKDSGVVVNNSHTYSGETLQDIIAREYAELFIHTDNDKSVNDIEDEDEYYENDFYVRSGIIHRLDKDTSGIILCAKDEDTFKYVQRQFKNREIIKEYIAVVFGVLQDDLVEINAPIGRNPKQPFKFAVTVDGKDAFTKIERNYSKEYDGEQITLVKLTPKTGRTHQLRVHLTALSNSVVHDEIYNTKKQYEWSLKSFKRLMLHSSRIQLTHPKTRNTLSLECPPPDDFNI